MNDVLLTISGHMSPTIEEDIAAGKRPLADYIAMAETFNADLIDYTKAQEVGGWFGRLLGKEGFDVRRLGGGIGEWQAQNLPLVKGK